MSMNAKLWRRFFAFAAITSFLLLTRIVFSYCTQCNTLAPKPNLRAVVLAVDNNGSDSQVLEMMSSHSVPVFRHSGLVNVTNFANGESSLRSALTSSAPRDVNDYHPSRIHEEIQVVPMLHVDSHASALSMPVSSLSSLAVHTSDVSSKGSKYFPRSDCSKHGCSEVLYPGPKPAPRTSVKDLLLFDAVCLANTSHSSFIPVVAVLTQISLPQCQMACVDNMKCKHSLISSVWVVLDMFSSLFGITLFASIDS